MIKSFIEPAPGHYFISNLQQTFYVSIRLFCFFHEEQSMHAAHCTTLYHHVECTTKAMSQRTQYTYSTYTF